MLYCGTDYRFSYVMATRNSIDAASYDSEPRYMSVRVEHQMCHGPVIISSQKTIKYYTLYYV